MGGGILKISDTSAQDVRLAPRDPRKRRILAAAGASIVHCDRRGDAPCGTLGQALGQCERQRTFREGPYCYRCARRSRAGRFGSGSHRGSRQSDAIRQRVRDDHAACGRRRAGPGRPGRRERRQPRSRKPATAGRIVARAAQDGARTPAHRVPAASPRKAQGCGPRRCFARRGAARKAPSGRGS